MAGAHDMCTSLIIPLKSQVLLPERSKQGEGILFRRRIGQELSDFDPSHPLVFQAIEFISAHAEMR